MTTLAVLASMFGVALTGTSPIVSMRSRTDLPQVFAALGYRTGVEIGTWQGAYAEALCQGIPGLRLRCVDPWVSYKVYNDKKNNQARLDAAYRDTCRRLKPYACLIDRRTSMDAVRDVADGSVDFVYIDGNHGEAFVRADLDGWTPKVRPGGILAGHDYAEPKGTHKHLDVKVAVDRFTRERGIDPWFVLAGDPSPSFLWVVT